MTLEDIPADLLLTVADIRKAGFCSIGQRRWAVQNGLDYADVIRDGILARTLFESGDAQAIRAVEFKMRMSDGSG